MATAGPTITGVTRHPSDPTILQVTYTVPVSGVTRVQLWERPQSGGTPVRIVDTTTLNGNISVHSRYAAWVPVTLHMTLTHATEGPSNPGGTYNVAAFAVATPTLVSAVRASATQATLTYSGLTVGMGSRCYIYRSAPGGNPVQVDAFDITASSGSRNAPAPSGTAAYEYEIRVGQHGILSAPSTRRSVEKWYQTPPAPTSFNVTRNASTGVVTGTWGAPSVTSRNRWTGIRLFRAFKGQPLKAWRTLPAAASSFTDTTTVLASAYDYGIESYNETGPSSSRPTASTNPVRERPNAASGLTVTHLDGDRYQLSWTTNATTERPITNQKILARVPGQTATTTLATAPGSVTSYTLTIPGNRIYELAILPTNGVGDASATSNWAGPAVARPYNATSLSASWMDASTVRVAWPLRAASIGDTLEIEFSTQANPDRNNPAHWSPLGAITNWRTNNFTTQPGASQLVPHTYRARAVHTGSGQASGWVYSDQLEGQAAPLAPTMVMPWRVDATQAITLEARHNPVDGTAITQGQIRHRLQGSTTWTTPPPATLVPGGVRGQIPANTYTNGSSEFVEVQGRTMGGSGVYGEWGHGAPGASLLVPLRALPTAAFTGPPSGTFEAQTLTVTWEASDQASADLELWDDTGGNLELLGVATVGPDVRSYTWADVVLRDGRDYAVDLLVRDAWQAAQPQRLGITVSYNLPAQPALTAEVQLSDASVLLQATPRNGLETLRTNYARVDMTDWQYTAGSLVTVGGRVARRIDPGNQARLLFDAPAAGEVCILAADVAFENEWQGGNRTIQAQLGTGETQLLASDNFASLPSFARASAIIVAGSGEMGRWEVTASGEQAYFSRPFATTVPAATTIDPAWLEFFDGDTVDPTGQKVYGWNSDGTSYEAIPNDAGDRVVAPTVSIEVWCSPTGEDGSWKRCGETGVQWDYHDRHPRIGVPLWYKARAVAASGAWAESVPVQVVVESRDTFVHFGPDHGSYVTAGRLVDALTIDGGGLDVESIQYEGHDGWTHHTSDVPLAESISTDLQLLPARGASSLQDWAHALRHSDIIYREPGGIVMRGAPSMGPRRPSSKFVQQLSLTVRGEML